MSFCSFLFPLSSPIKVGTFFSSRVFPKTTLCSEWGHCPHFLIQWQRLWESSMLLVVQAKRCKWLYWKSICSCEVLLVSEFFTICHFALTRVARGLQLWVSEFEVLFFSCVFYHEYKVKGSFGVLFVYSLEEEMCGIFFFDDRSWTATEECSCHPQCGFISEVKFEQTLEGRCRLLKSRNAVGNSPLIPESEKLRHCSVEFCQCGRADVLILYKECLGCQQS